jgi:hypothetical protein
MESFAPILITLLFMAVAIIVMMFFEQPWREWHLREDFRRERRVEQERRKRSGGGD